MNGLYPIIRRVRRPLLPTEVLPDGHQADAKVLAHGHQVVQAAPALEPAAAGESAPRSETQPKRKDRRGKAAAAQSAQ